MKQLRKLILALALSAGLAPAFAQVPPAVPALPDTERRTSYSITASVCSCNVGFSLFGDSTDVGNWIEVFVNGVRMSQAGNWTLSSATGTIGSIPLPITNAVLTFTAPQTGTIQIVGARRPRRTSQFNEGAGVPTRNFNVVLSDLTAQNRELWDKTNDVTGRALLSQPGNTLSMLPLPSACGGKFLGFDATGLIPQCNAGGAGSGNVVGPLTSTIGNVAVFNNATGNLLADAGKIRSQLTADANYYIRTDGNDSCNGLVNVGGSSGACAWKTLHKALINLCGVIDAAGFNVTNHIQGMGSSATYTEDQLNMCNWEGWFGNGFNQAKFVGENGTVTIAANPGAVATIFATQTGPPIVWESVAVQNLNASGIIFEADDNGFLPLHNVTFAGCGAGGIAMVSILNGSRILLESGTYPITADCATFIYAHDMGQVINQPGTTYALSGSRTFSNAIADVDSVSQFQNLASVFTGTTPTAVPYRLIVPGKISDVSLIPGSLSAVITALPVGSGGTGQISWTSGGIPYANSATSLASSGTLVANAPILGGGAGVAPVSLAAAGSDGQLLTGQTGTVPIFRTMSADATFSVAGALTIANNAVTNAKAAQMAANSIKGNNTGGTANAADLTVVQLSAMFTKPTVQLFTTGSGTYTKTANATWIEVELVGAGGGGAGSGTSPAAATVGGNTCFNTSGAACTTPVYQGGGGTLGSAAGATAAAGGTVSGSGTCSDSQPGGSGGAGAITPSAHGGIGGASRYGGEGAPGWGGANNASAAATNSGSGGGGAGENATANAGGGGGAGAWCYAIITAPAASYTYAIGAAGSAGGAGTGGNTGAAGAAGKLRVIEHYN